MMVVTGVVEEVVDEVVVGLQRATGCARTHRMALPMFKLLFTSLQRFSESLSG